jgi:hypothetical protein
MGPKEFVLHNITAEKLPSQENFIFAGTTPRLWWFDLAPFDFAQGQ